MRYTLLPLLPLFLLPALAHAASLDVGPGKPFAKIEDALAKAAPGDTINVFPQEKNAPYLHPALLVKTKNLTLRSAAKDRVKLDGDTFNYSGRGPVPRAIIQFDPGSDGSTLDGFELSGAHNESFNGAGVRINQADSVTIKNCTIDHNDMGIMSHAANQLIEGCTITDNGTQKQPGQNHNLYLGGESVTVRACEIARSLTGHNLKSRAHFNLIEFNFIHDSANRELDLVDDAGITDTPNSDTILLGNIITKAPNMSGNKAVIHFGQDGGKDHTGTLYLIHNTITTPYAMPVVTLSAKGASAQFFNNIFTSKNTAATLLTAQNGAALDQVLGQGNTFSPTFKTLPLSIKTDAPLPWEKIPWPQKKKEDTLQYFISPGQLAPRKDTAPGATP